MDSEEIIDLLADFAYAGVQLLNGLLAWRTRPVSLKILINEKETGMTVQVPDDQPIPIHVVVVDHMGEMVTTPVAGVTVTASNPGLVSLAQDAAGHAGDDTFWIGTPTAGSGQFVLNAAGDITAGDGTALHLTGVSDELDIQPGAPAALGVEITAAPAGT